MDKLDFNQKKAVFTENRFALISAAPGAGKTTVLLQRASYLIETKAVSGASIAIITFTKAATENMKTRFGLFYNKDNKPFIGTFHSLFYHTLNKKRKLELIDEALSTSLIKRVLNDYANAINEDKAKEVLNSIAQYKNYKYGLYSFEGFEPCIDMSIFMKCYNYYEEYKKKNLLVDFEDLQIEVLKLIDSVNIKSTFLGKFKHMLIDEFQDSDSLEIEFLKKMSNISSIYAVGDEDQSIYSFRNARPDCMVNFEKYFPSGKKIFLSINYRCPANITILSKEIIKHNFNRNDKSLCSFKKEDGGIYLYKCSNEIDTAKSVTDIIEREVCNNIYNYKDFAVLFRTRFESSALIDSMISRKIPFTIFDNIYNIYDHFIFRDLLNYLRLAIDNFDAEAFSNIINKPERFISKIYIEKIQGNRFRTNCFDYLLYEERLNNLQKLKVFLLKVKISKILRLHPVDAVRYIFNNIGYNIYLDDLLKKNKIDANEINFIKEEISTISKQFDSLEKFMEHAHMLEEKNKVGKINGVSIGTIHGVKGMEFKNIIIMNCIDGIIPYRHKNIIFDIEEERRLFYVAITRTIENLFMFMPKKLNGLSMESSRFINECNSFRKYLV